MGKLLLVSLSLVIFSASAQQTSDSQLVDAKQRCVPETSGDPILYNDEFRWGYTLEEMGQRYEEIYNSGKRLQKRAYYNPKKDQFFMNHYSSKNKVNPVPITNDFLIAIRQQIEEALKRDYVQYVFFPDMGHAHAFIPQTYYDEVIKKIAGPDHHLRYEKILGFPATKLLYHTAEQLHMKDKETKKLVDDDFLRWRYYTRNLVGGLKPPAKIEIHKKLNDGFNTVHDYPEHKYWGAGFDISASKDGCFAFKTKSGETHYFDISLYSLEMDPNVERDMGMYSDE